MSKAEQLVAKPSRELRARIEELQRQADQHAEDNPITARRDPAALAVWTTFDVEGEESAIEIRCVPGKEPELTALRPEDEAPSE